MKNHNTQILNEIAELKKQKNAVILAHYYQVPEIQNIADFIGDSLELAKKAQNTQADRLVFCGVHFMAEGAKILNPKMKVLLPDLRAGCSLSDSCPPDEFREFKKQNPDHFVVSYINTSAAIKALSDVICTSSNAVQMIHKIPKETPILFGPDRNLGRWVERETGRKLLLWQGSCIVHETFSQSKLKETRDQNPGAKLIAHPECEEWLLNQSDFIASTSGLLKYVQNSKYNEFIVATEAGILHQMAQSAPNKKLIPAPTNHNCACNECPFMKLNTLEKLRDCLKNDSPEIVLDPEIAQKALLPLERMLEWSK